MNKTLIIPATILAATLALAGISDAHNALATPGCGGLSWSATNFDKTVVNAITVKVDGVTVHADLDFKASDQGSTPWPQTAPHAWSVVVNAPGTEFDRAFAGTWQACVATTTTVAATTTTTLNTTTTTLNTGTTTPTTTPPTTALVAVDIPPVPCPYNPTVPADSPDCTAPTTTVAASDVVSVEPALPRTGAGETVGFIGLALLMVAVGGYLAIKGRRVR